MSQKKLEPEEWDFGDLLPGEEKAAAIWEYARESETLRKANSLENLFETREVLWLKQLSFIFGKAYLKSPWIIASKEWHNTLPDRIKRERKQFLRATADPESRKKMRQILDQARPMSPQDPIVVSDSVGASLVFRGTMDLHSQWRLVKINVAASKKEVLADIEKTYNNAQKEGIKLKGRGKDKPSEWRARLEWLGTLRLNRVHTVREIAQTRKTRGETADLSIERKIKRDVQRARKTFRALYPFLPSGELAR